MLETPREWRGPIETELFRRAADPTHRAILERLLRARAQDADEYLGDAAGVARHYLAVLDVRQPKGVDS